MTPALLKSISSRDSVERKVSAALDVAWRSARSSWRNLSEPLEDEDEWWAWMSSIADWALVKFRAAT